VNCSLSTLHCSIHAVYKERILWTLTEVVNYWNSTRSNRNIIAENPWSYQWSQGITDINEEDRDSLRIVGNFYPTRQRVRRDFIGFIRLKSFRSYNINISLCSGEFRIVAFDWTSIICHLNRSPRSVTKIPVSEKAAGFATRDWSHLPSAPHSV
jgi:hypothetical protein